MTTTPTNIYDVERLLRSGKIIMEDIPEAKNIIQNELDDIDSQLTDRAIDDAIRSELLRRKIVIKSLKNLM